MADLVLPPLLRQARIKFSYIDNTGLTRGEFSGLPLTTALGGDRVSASVEFTLHGGKTSAEQSLLGSLRSFVFAMKGKQNRVYLTPDSHSRRGSFPATELLLNADFSGGNTEWTCSTEVTRSVTEGVYRGTANQAFSSSVDIIRNVTAATTTQYVPYVMRWVMQQGRYPGNAAARWRNGAGAAIATGSSITAPNQYIVDAYTVESTTALFALNASTTGNPIAGDYFLIPFASVSRCLLVDGGGNFGLRSDELDNASWTKTRATVTANAASAPNGTATVADRIVEDGTASNTHIVVQTPTRTTGIVDLCIYGFFKRGVGTRNVALYIGNSASNYSWAVFDLGAGTVGAATDVGTGTNGRAFIAPAGGGWYYCSVISRQASATTSYMQIGLTSGSNPTYSGDSTSAVDCWRVGAQISSVPTRGSQTTTAAVAATTQNGAAGIYVKGGRAPGEAALPNALLFGDWVEIDGQLVMVTAPLDLDAAGFGYLQTCPPLMRDVADNTPIIVHRPMGRFLYAGDNPSFDIEPGPFGKASLEFEAAPPTT